MRLNFLKPTRKEQALVKEFALNTPPQRGFRVKNVDSFVIELNSPTPIELLESITRMADQGYAYIPGQLTRELRGESRKGMINPDSYTSICPFDLDHVLDHGGMTPSYEDIFDALPLFNETSSVVQYSASHGVMDQTGQPVKQGLNAHGFFMFDEPVKVSWLRFLMPWLSMKYLDWACRLKDLDPDCLELPFDEAVGVPSQILSLTPPTVRAPFTDTHQGARIQLVKRTNDTICVADLKALIDSKIKDQNKYIRERKLMKLNSLRDDQDLAPFKPRMESKEWDGTLRAVVTNPTPHRMVYVGDDNGFSRYYRDGGDPDGSPAYFHATDKPEVLGSFNTSFPPCDFRTLDPIAYAEACQRVDKAIETTTELVQSIFYDPALTCYFGFKLDNAENTIELESQKNRQNAIQYMEGDKLEAPERIPNWRIVFEPTQDFLLKDGKVNRHVMPELIRALPPSRRSIDRALNPVKYGPGDLLSWIHAQTPGIGELLLHVCGGDTNVMLHYLNWVFYQVQTGLKPETAFVFTGRTGTGKGLMTKKFLKPLFGNSTKVITPSQISRDFNEWKLDGRLIVVDEGSGHDKASKSLQDAISELKHDITEPTIMLNQKFLPSVEVTNHLAFTFTSNSHDPIYLGDDDRRFNIAPRQDARLNAILGRPLWNGDHKYRVEVDEILDQEIKRIAEMLFTYDVDIGTVLTPMDNEAKRQMREVVKSVPEVFMSQLEQGNLDFFVNHWLAVEEQGAMGMENQLALTSITQFLRAVCERLTEDPTAPVPMSITMGHALFATVAGANIDRYKEERFRKEIRYTEIPLISDETGRDYLQISFKLNKYQPSTVLKRLTDNATMAPIDMITPDYKEMH